MLNNSPYCCGVYLDLSRFSSKVDATTRTRSPRISLRISFRRGDPDASTRSALLKAVTFQDTANLHNKAVLEEAYTHSHTCVYSRKVQAQPRRHTHPVDDHGGTDATSSSAAAAAVEPPELRIARDNRRRGEAAGARRAARDADSDAQQQLALSMHPWHTKN